MSKIKVNDINMYYEAHGDGFPLVMIMGLSANIDWWTPELIEVGSKNFKTIVFDNRGAGRSDVPDIEYSIKMFADDTAGLMDALNIERAHILGISMGGMIAQELVLNYPEKVEKLILCSTMCGGSKFILPSKDVMELMMKDREDMDPKEVAKETIPLLFTKDFIKDNPEYIEETIERILIAPISPSSYQRQGAAVMKFNAGRRLKTINTPTLVMHGKKDILLPSQNGEIIAKLIPGAKLSLFDNSAHALFSEEPEAVNNTVFEFLNS